MKRLLLFLGITMSVFRLFAGRKHEEAQVELVHEDEFSTPSLFGVFLTGLTLGALATALMTPTSGGILRSNIRGKVNSVQKQVGRNAASMSKRLRQRGRSVKDAGAELLHKLHA